MTSAYKPCFLRGPVDSLEECKVLKEYSKSMLRSGHIKIMKPAIAVKKRNKAVEFDGSIKESNIVVYDYSIPKEKKGGN